MDMIKMVVKQFYPLMIMLSCVLFVVYIFFSANPNDGKDIFEGVGNVFAPMIGTDEVKNDGLSYKQSGVSGYIPIIKYNVGPQKVGNCVSFRELFLVQKEDGSFVNGNTDDGFALYLEDIRNQNGNCVLEWLSSEEIAEMEEIPASFVYDKEQDLLYIYGSGTFVVYIKVYGSSGGSQIYEFNLPVEAL